MNRFFQAVVGREIKAQMRAECGKLPDYVIACVGGGSNAIGAFNCFLGDDRVHLIGVEAGGAGIRPGSHAARFRGGVVGVVEGYKSYWLQNEDGQVADTHSISAGLDYAGIGPLHARLRETGRAEYTYALDRDVVKAFRILAETEGILASLESSHAVAEAIRLAPALSRTKSIVVNISGRAEKDLFILAEALRDEEFHRFVERYASSWK
jgi:tryptophan synthase beta chain